MVPMRSAAAAIGVAALMLVTGLTGATPAAAAPVAGACFDYPVAAVDEISSPAAAIGCEAPHSAETFAVRALAERFGPPSKASVAARLTAASGCTVKAMNAYLGMPRRSLPSRFQVAALFPTDAQWAAGERWVRCDAVLRSGLGLQRITGPGAAFVASVPQADLNFCTPSTPSARNTAAARCTNPKRNWIKVLDQRLGGPTARYPGDASVMRRSALICQKAAKRYDGKVPIPGWWRINPTQTGWGLGKRSVQCFVPYQQYLKELAQTAPAPTPAPTPVPTPGAEPTPAPSA
ncbi:MAG: septum formation family protein [Candidatus Nanopelagicales bacterium]